MDIIIYCNLWNLIINETEVIAFPSVEHNVWKDETEMYTIGIIDNKLLVNLNNNLICYSNYTDGRELSDTKYKLKCKSKTSTIDNIIAMVCFGITLIIFALFLFFVIRYLLRN